MKTDNNSLIDDLLVMLESCTRAAAGFKLLPETRLNYKEHPEKWSILECLEHLNRYGDYYLPEIEKAVLRGKCRDTPPAYQSGIFGNYFANLMRIKDGKITKMKTPRDKNPSGSALTVATVDRFLQQQETLKGLLNDARQADLTNTTVPLSLARFIRLRLGDTLRFFIYHIERHVVQAEKVLTVG